VTVLIQGLAPALSDGSRLSWAAPSSLHEGLGRRAVAPDRIQGDAAKPRLDKAQSRIMSARPRRRSAPCPECSSLAPCSPPSSPLGTEETLFARTKETKESPPQSDPLDNHQPHTRMRSCTSSLCRPPWESPADVRTIGRGRFQAVHHPRRTRRCSRPAARARRRVSDLHGLKVAMTLASARARPSRGKPARSSRPGRGTRPV
jgi:hypothetical protein